MNRVISAINFFETEPLSPCVSIKTLGMLFDSKLNLPDHFNQEVSICYSIMISEIWVKLHPNYQ